MNYEDEMRNLAEEVRNNKWVKKKWNPSPALLCKKSKVITKYSGQKYDSNKFELIENGWDHDHCLFCWQCICDSGSKNCKYNGFTDGEYWICETCHQKVIVERIDVR